MRNKILLEIILLNSGKYRFIASICFLILLQNSICTQTDYFGVFDVDFIKVNNLTNFIINLFYLKYFTLILAE